MIHIKKSFESTLCGIILCLPAAFDRAFADVSVSLLATPKYNTYSSDTLFDVPKEFIDKPQLTSEHTFEFTGNVGNKFADISYLFNVQKKLSDTSSPDYSRDTNELHISKEFGNWDFTVGRKIDSWGVGYGFRPLDVVQQYDQQTTSRLSAIGKNRLSVEYFFDISSWTLMWVNFGSTDEKDSRRQEAVVSKFSTSGDNYDLHLITQYSKENRLQFGAGGVAIVTDALSLHGSLLYSQRYSKNTHRLIGQIDQLLSSEYPYVNREFDDGLQAVAGLNWSSENKHGIIAEYWYNEFAYSRQQWKKHYSLTRQQRALLGESTVPSAFINGNIAWMASATQTRSLAQHNLMLQWNYEAEYWKPAINILLAPVDKSSMTTLSVIRTYQSFYVESGVRMFNGVKESVYGGLILSNIFYLTISSEIW